MTPFIAPLLALASVNSMVGLLIWVAVAAIVVWAIIALVKWSGVQIPQPVWIILIALGSIILILIIARAFGFAT